MVFGRSQTENMSRDELVEELLKLSDVSSKLSELTKKFKDIQVSFVIIDDTVLV